MVKTSNAYQKEANLIAGKRFVCWFVLNFTLKHKWVCEYFTKPNLTFCICWKMPWGQIGFDCFGPCKRISILQLWVHWEEKNEDIGRARAEGEIEGKIERERGRKRERSRERDERGR